MANPKERATVGITTPRLKQAVVLKEYATGRESTELQNIYLESAKITVIGNTPKIDGFDMKAEEKVIAKMIELLVVSVDGEKEDLVNTILDMPAEDTNFVVDKLNELTGKKKPEEQDKP